MAIATTTRKATDAAAVQLNIAKALRETKEELNQEVGMTLTDLEKVCGLDDSTISKVLDASRQIQYRYVEDIVFGFNKILGHERFTANDMVLRYNSAPDIAKLPPKLGFSRFLDRQRQVPAPASPKETAAISELVEKRRINGVAGTMTKTIEIVTVYTIEPMPTLFKKGESYVIKVGDAHRVVAFPFTGDDEEFEVLGRVVGARTK